MLVLQAQALLCHNAGHKDIFTIICFLLTQDYLMIFLHRITLKLLGTASRIGLDLVPRANLDKFLVYLATSSLPPFFCLTTW